MQLCILSKCKSVFSFTTRALVIQLFHLILSTSIVQEAVYYIYLLYLSIHPSTGAAAAANEHHYLCMRELHSIVRCAERDPNQLETLNKAAAAEEYELNMRMSVAFCNGNSANAFAALSTECDYVQVYLFGKVTEAKRSTDDIKLEFALPISTKFNFNSTSVSLYSCQNADLFELP